MGIWGMGLTQSDEFCEVYDKFMEEYNSGKEPHDISESILTEYYSEFNDNDGVMHDVYFALAKAEWMCCAQSEKVLLKVKEIINTDANIAFYRELCATESDLRARKKSLQKFWNSLQAPRKFAKKRVTPPKNIPVAILDKGTVFWYKRKSKYFAAIVLDIVDNKFFVALSDELNAAPKTVDSILNANARMASWFSVLIPENQVHALAKIESNENYNGRMGMYFDADANIHFCENCGLEDYWDGFNDYKQRWTFSNLNLRDLLLSENVPVEFVMREQLKQFLREKKC